MMKLLIDGRKAREDLKRDLKKRVSALSFMPTLAIIQVGSNPDSSSFIRGKKAFAEKIGIIIRHIQISQDATQNEVTQHVHECNNDPTVQGIIVQLPLPQQIGRDEVIDSINPKKDADALTRERVKEWSTPGNVRALFPATARGVMELLAYYDFKIKGQKVVVVGRSELVGRPIAIMCANAGATVTVCHSKTPDLVAETILADILIVAVGKPGLIQAKHVKKGAVVIDVGINTSEGKRLEDEPAGDNQTRTLVGDVAFEAVEKVASAVSPVPGGVGPMTVLSLFENLLDLCESSL